MLALAGAEEPAPTPSPAPATLEELAAKLAAIEAQSGDLARQAFELSKEIAAGSKACSVAKDLAFVGELSGAVARFYDAQALARSTARISMAGPVGKMQEIAQELAAAHRKAPPCARIMAEAAAKGAKADVTYMLALMRGERRESRAPDWWGLYNDERLKGLDSELAALTPKPGKRPAPKKTPSRGTNR